MNDLFHKLFTLPIFVRPGNSKHEDIKFAIKLIESVNCDSISGHFKEKALPSSRLVSYYRDRLLLNTSFTWLFGTRFSYLERMNHRIGNRLGRYTINFSILVKAHSFLFA